QDVIDEAAHFVYAPAAPGPELRRHEVENGNAAEMGPPRHPPVKARIIDQHDRVGALGAEVTIGAGQEIEKDMGIGQDTEEPHHRQAAQWVEEPAAGGLHLLTTIADTFHIGMEPAQLADQVGAVEVAARFAGTDENSHWLPCLINQEIPDQMWR